MYAVCCCLQDQLGCAELVAAALRGTCCLLAALNSRTAATAAAAAGTADHTAAPAADAAAALAGYVLQQLQQLAGNTSAAQSDAENARRLAVTAAGPAAAAAVLASTRLSQQQLAAAAQQAQQLACGAGAEGRLGGAAAVAWVQLVCMQMCQSSSSVTDQVRTSGQGVDCVVCRLTSCDACRSGNVMFVGTVAHHLLLVELAACSCAVHSTHTISSLPHDAEPFTATIQITYSLLLPSTARWSNLVKLGHTATRSCPPWLTGSQQQPPRSCLLLLAWQQVLLQAWLCCWVLNWHAAAAVNGQQHSWQQQQEQQGLQLAVVG
jgi:hypothetical protein